MKKFALLLAVAALAATPAAAASKHKRAKQQESVFAKQTANTLRILRDGAPLVLPSWALPVYFGMGMDTTQKRKKHKR
ncbi:MAG: hypothetical protein P8Y53_05615 [Pseudolabrys sp.]